MNILDNYGESERAECTLALSQPPADGQRWSHREREWGL